MNALTLGLKIAMASGLPLNIYTLLEKKEEQYYRELVKKNNMESLVNQHSRLWHFYKKPEFETMLYEIPHDSLIVLGAYGHGVIKEILLGSKMEHIQSTMTNNLLITGPHCKISLQ